ncbi:MAG TPA: methyltransferase domain-containing protein [Ilumatobacter sp.]|nr:methyltransferase domain-containing protein [Ilumatobacter sp.]
MDLSERGAGAARHPWEVERFRAYRRVLADHGALSARRILDVGAGDGWFGESLITDLPHVEQLVCWDVNYSEYELTTDDPRVTRTVEVPEPGFDLVLVLDVLEHIEDPAGFVTSALAPVSGPGTPALVAVPGHPALFGNHDRALGHHRRYRAGELLAQLEPWIDVVDHGPLFTSLVPLRATTVAAERVRRRPHEPGAHGVGGWRGGPLLTRVARAPLAADSAVTRRLGPLRRHLTGLSHWAYGYTR